MLLVDYGGEEFLVVLPNVFHQLAKTIMDKLRFASVNVNHV